MDAQQLAERLADACGEMDDATFVDEPTDVNRVGDGWTFSVRIDGDEYDVAVSPA